MTSSTKRIASFLTMAFGISWSIVGRGVALGAGPSQPLGYMLMAALSMFGPAMAAIIQQRLMAHPLRSPILNAASHSPCAASVHPERTCG